MININILIKYAIEGNFIENNEYLLKFNYNKASNIITLENFSFGQDFSVEFLKEINGKNVKMIYKGKSRIDGLCLFLINSSKVRREYKISEILDGNK
jgi:hypothetical protein